MSRKVVSPVDCWVSLELAASEAARPWGPLGRICGVAAGKSRIAFAGWGRRRAVDAHLCFSYTRFFAPRAGFSGADYFASEW